MDLIERQKMIDLWEQYHPYIAIKACEYDAKLRRLPSAQPERMTGKWKLLQNGDAICQKCKHVQKSAWDMDGWDNFCHHCGADMRGEADG